MTKVNFHMLLKKWRVQVYMYKLDIKHDDFNVEMTNTKPNYYDDFNVEFRILQKDAKVKMSFFFIHRPYVAARPTRFGLFLSFLRSFSIFVFSRVFFLYPVSLLLYYFCLLSFSLFLLLYFYHSVT